jgi:hypothetical protein
VHGRVHSRRGSAASFGRAWFSDIEPIAPSVSVPLVESDSESESEDESETLLERIHSCIAYTRAQHALGEAVAQVTRFSVSTTANLGILSLLRLHGTLIASAANFEEYELGVPRPDWVAQGILPGVHDPQWWVGKTAAEVKAGAHADEAMVKRAAAHLKCLQTKRDKKKGLTAHEKENEWKLKEGLRRQEAGEKMGDWESGDEEDEDDLDMNEDEGGDDHHDEKEIEDEGGYGHQYEEMSDDEGENYHQGQEDGSAS